MQRRKLVMMAGALASGVFGQGPALVARPKYKLLLAITVDQFRYDYLTRFRGEYSGGLARLLTQGAVFTNAFYEHTPTVTAVGHSTILSGASPALSGIVGNDWWDRATSKEVTSVSDPSLQTLGAPERQASSPHRMLVSTVGDEIKMAAKGESRAIGISFKDRSAILPVGRMADAAYWFDNETGNFVSSTWYQKRMPGWVDGFNGKKVGEKYLGVEWKAGDVLLKKMPTKADTMFYSNMEASPFGNDLLEEFAEQTIENERLGSHAGVDLLSVSFSCNDYVGHAEGPDSPHAHDMSVRTDKMLAKLFAFLDRKIGMKNVLVAFTADHGVAPVPEVNTARKMPGGRLKDKDIGTAIEAALSAKYGAGKWLANEKSQSVPYLNYDLMAARRLDAAEVRRVAADAVRKLPHIARVYTKDQLIAGIPITDFVARRVQNGYYAGRGPDLVVIPEPYYMYAAKGTTHGAPFHYDAQVPVILMGAGVKAGRYHRAAAVNDIAPTVATLLDVAIPSGSMGRVLDECLTY
jgi:predicted AlkP superfamily pyrophosphatase or phosphodiesterase